VRKRSGHLGWPEDKQFYIPDEALAHFAKAFTRRALENEWQALVEEYRSSSSRKTQKLRS
jgi:transketolase